MSNEWNDYQRDLREDFDHNFECAIDGIPDGWMKSFMPQFKEELFEVCKKELPEYVQPVDFIFIDEMPLTPIGKINYCSLEKEAEKL